MSAPCTFDLRLYFRERGALELRVLTRFPRAHDQTRLPVLPVAPRVETASNGHGASGFASDSSCPHTDSPTSFDGAGQASSSPSSFGADSTPSSGAGGQTPAGAYSPSQAAYEPSAPPPDEKEPKKEG